MRDALRSEWIKLATVRSHWVLAIVASAFPFVITVLTSLLADDLSGTDVASMVTTTTILSGLLWGVIGVLSVAQEAVHGTLRVTFAAIPVRRRVLAAKVILMAAVSAVSIGVTVFVTGQLGAAILRGRDLDVQLAPTSAARDALVGVVLLAVLLTLLGLGLGMLIRNVPAAVAVLLVWPLIVENLVGGLLSLALGDSVVRYLPYLNGFQMAILERFDGAWGSRWANGAYFALWVGAITVIGVIINERRDA